MTEQEYLELFIEQMPQCSHWTHAIFAYNKKNQLIHGAFYENLPDDEDVSIMTEELATDKRLRMTKLIPNKDFTLKVWSKSV